MKMKLLILLAHIGTAAMIVLTNVGCATTPASWCGADNGGPLIEELGTHAPLSDWQRSAIVALLRGCGRSDIITIDYTSGGSIQWMRRYVDREDVVAIEYLVCSPDSRRSDEQSLQYRVHGAEVVASYDRIRSMMLKGPAIELGGGNGYRAHFTVEPLVLIEATHPTERLKEGDWAPSLNGIRDDSNLNPIDAICFDAYLAIFDDALRTLATYRTNRE
jgi:hypothetical protein